MHDHPVRAFSLAFSFQADRGFISYIDPADSYDRIPYIRDHRPHSVLLGHLQFGPEFQSLAAAARQAGAQILMDCQATPATLETPGVVEALGSVDVFLPNASEALQLTGASSVSEAAEILSGYTPLVVVKMGSEGALAQAKAQCVQSPALEIPSVDTTGAGDCFNAGFLYSRLRGEPLIRNLEAGNICGGLSTTRHGTIATPTESELAAWRGLK
jgi:sugar/nucleoside kinase (ribokinase family)